MFDYFSELRRSILPTTSQISRQMKEEDIDSNSELFLSSARVQGFHADAEDTIMELNEMNRSRLEAEEEEMRERTISDIAERLKMIGDELNEDPRLRKVSRCQRALHPSQQDSQVFRAFHAMGGEISRAFLDIFNNNSPFITSQNAMAVLRIPLDTLQYFYPQNRVTRRPGASTKPGSCL